MHLFYYLPNFNQLQSAHAGMVLHIVILRRCTFDTRVMREDPHCFGRGKNGIIDLIFFLSGRKRESAMQAKIIPRIYAFRLVRWFIALGGRCNIDIDTNADTQKRVD